MRVVLGMKIKKNGRHVIKTSLSSAVLLSLLLGGQVFAADPLVINNDTGTANTVSESDNSTVIGDGNTVTNSKSQTVVGNNNKVTNRTHKDRDENITDLTIGNGNIINRTTSWPKAWESLTVIGNNNTFIAPTNGIVIGDN